MTAPRWLMRKQWFKRGSVLWYAAVIPRRLKREGWRVVRGYIEQARLRKALAPRLAAKALRRHHVTVVITSAGRLFYLEQTINSLRNNFLYDPAKVRWLIIDDYPAARRTREYIAALNGFDLCVFNSRNRGLGYCLNRLYAEIDTEYVFHCEDDWRFLRPIPVTTMIDVLETHSHLRQLLLAREMINGRDYRGTVTPTSEGFAVCDHKFSFNPHLAKTALFHQHQPYPLFHTELEYTLKLERAGQRVSGILGYGGEPYVRHIGELKYATVV